MRLSTPNDSKPDNYQINAKICRLVERYPCMYDRSHPHYLKKDVVDKAWVKISKEMDDSIPSCKERWRNIRTSFARSINVNKIPSSANRTKPYYLHEELQFLARHITPGIPVSRRPNYYTSADEKSEMIEVPIGEESFDGFVAMAAQEEEEEEEQQRHTDEDDSRHERAPSSSGDEATQSGKGEQQMVQCQQQSTEEMQTDATERKLPMQNSPLPLLSQHMQQQPPMALPQQQQLVATPPIEALEVERIVAEVPVVPLYPFKKRLRTAESMMCAEVEQERDIKPQPSELCTPDPDFDAAFLQGLLPEMKAMDFRQKIIFKKRIYEVIGEIFESTTHSSSTARRPSHSNSTHNGNISFASSNGTPLSNGYTNGYTSSNKRRTPTPRPTPANSPSASGYASPSNMLNSASPTAMTVVNAADLAILRRLSTLLQSPAVASSTTAMTALPKNVASISSTVRHSVNTPPTTAASPASASAHRGAMTRSSANLLRTNMINGATPSSSTTYASASSTPAAASHAVKQELLDD
ncbi:PREDICTED: uncharacterized protein LOC108977739 [Bactrocera latifrons]|uniref:Transcription factor Adf-1 n=1 Tax=Bactrocera latifrons TaxID=174628 RepID=A0A0K8VHJ4_BACLA|nr:PREDICTED: uncharacterized protein LOC108977739 [Bactrocera latifrons]